MLMKELLTPKIKCRFVLISRIVSVSDYAVVDCFHLLSFLNILGETLSK